MKIFTYEELLNSKNAYKFIDTDIIDKLIYNNINYYNSNDIAYFLLVLPTLNITNKIYNDSYSLIEKKVESKYYDYSVPSFVFNKVIFIYNYKLNKFILIKSNKFTNKFINFNKKTIINILISITNNLQNIINIHNNLVMNINNSLLNIDYIKINILTKYVDKLIIYTHYCSNALQQLNNIKILLNDSHEFYYILNKNIINLVNINNKLKDDLQNIRQTSFQKITYIETGTSRILTSIATVFLPLSFIIAFFSLPFKNVPLQNKKNGIIYLLFFVIILFILSYTYLKIHGVNIMSIFL